MMNTSISRQMPPAILRHLLLSLLVVTATLAMGTVAMATVAEHKIVHEGIAVELEVEPIEAAATAKLREGDTVKFRFKITDTNTETPLSGVYPAAWMDRRPEGPEPETCQDKVEAFIGGSLFAPPELDLNVYYVLALNNDATLSVVDPLFGFGTTKLLDMVFLESPGEDWVLSDDQTTLYVSMPEVNRVAVISTASWEVTANLNVGLKPSRLALQEDGRYLWVGFDGIGDGLSGVTIIDTEGPAQVAEILTGRGPHAIAFSADDRFAYVTNRGSGTVSIVDVGKLEKVKDVATGREPVSLAYASMANAVYVASRADGVVVAIDGESHRVVARAELGPGLAQIKFAPGGQLGFIVNSEKDEVHILDAALGRVVQTADVEAGPDQVTFSDHLAYIRHQGSEAVLMIPLDQIGREGSPVPVIDFPGGQLAFGKGSRPSPADGIVQAPGATAVLVANPADKTIYFYKEGMAAPMGSFQNYGRQPRAVLAVDRSLEEMAPGTYETIATLRSPGRYDLAFFLDSPRTIHCFEMAVAPNPELTAERHRKRPVEVQPLIDPDAARAGGRLAVQVGEKVALKFRLTDSATQDPRLGVQDVQVFTFRAPGIRSRRQAARPVGDGVYEAAFAPSEAGIYYAFVESASLGLKRNASRFLVVVAEAPPEADTAGTTGHDASAGR